MNVKISKSLGLIAVVYFTAGLQAQQSDTLTKETKIEEVVVIGYGTQKKSNVTGAIASIKSSDIEDIPAGKPEQVLQGRAAGVSVITNSGQPGSGATVRVRGITSFGAGGNDPLWVVDGIVVDGISWLSQSDIESMEILKDGASSAIYGVSAARGVVLVTTKKGKKGKMNLSYNGSYGISNASRKLDLLNGSQYASIINEALVNGGGQPRFANPESYGKGTDWQDVIFNSAERTNHEFSVSGGNDKSTFFSSFGYFDQEGIVMGDISKYKRVNVRLNSTHKVFDFLTIGQTFAYTHSKSQGIDSNGSFGGPLSSAINLDPLTPVVVNDMSQVNANDYSNPHIIRDANGNPYGISNNVGQEMTNPLAFKQTQLGRYGWSDDFIANVFAELKLNQNLTFKTTLNGKQSYWGNEGFTPLFYLSPTNSNTSFNSLFRQSQKKLEWNVENTLTFGKRWGAHNLTALVGQGAYWFNIGNGLNTTYTDLPVNDYRDASFNFAIPQENKNTNAWDGIEARKASYFARVVYDYADKYLFTGTIRRDGTSKFANDYLWGNFPSFSLGWNISKEDFWPENNVVNTLKLRGGYGVLGNDAIGDFQFASFITSGSNYTMADNKIIIGYSPSVLANPLLRWEETTQTNIAADVKFLNNFTLTVDAFKKVSTDILRQVDIPGYVGMPNRPFKNIGDMENQGVEVELGYKKNWNDFSLSVNGNFSYLENKITKLEDDKQWEGFGDYHSMGTVSRLSLNESYGSFYGYKNLGIFQNQSQIAGHVDGAGNLIQPNAKPGDFIWHDTNGDGKIDDTDMVNLGNSVPKYTFGMTVNMNYKNWDLMVFAQGHAGNKIFQGLRRLDMLYANYQTAVLDRWVGEGTSNDYPRLTTNDSNGNFSKMSDFYLQKGDYLRLKLVQLGYTLPKSMTESFGASKVRFYVTGENLFTFTKYTGYDPEIAGGSTYGIDRAYYPQARTYMFGANIHF